LFSFSAVFAENVLAVVEALLLILHVRKSFESFAIREYFQAEKNVDSINLLW
jgi:hypothetical protein